MAAAMHEGTSRDFDAGLARSGEGAKHPVGLFEYEDPDSGAGVLEVRIWSRAQLQLLQAWPAGSNGADP